MIIYLYGQDTKRSREHLAKMVEKFYRERDPQKMNVVRVCVGDEGAPDVQNELMTTPFLAEKRLVIVERFLERGDAAAHEWFAARFLDTDPPPHVITVLWEEELVKKSRPSVESLHTRLAATKFAQEFAPLEGKKRIEFIVRAVADAGGSITTDAAEELHRRITNDFELRTTLEILIAYVHGVRPIRAEDLDLFLPPDVENTIFAAMDELAAGRKQRAMQLLANVWHVDNDPVYIFAMLHRQARLLFEAHDLLRDNPTTHEETAAKKMGVHPFVAKKMLGAARNVQRADLMRWYDRLIEIDYAFKHGTVDAQVLIDKFVAA